jgi:hypothetical protein
MGVIWLTSSEPASGCAAADCGGVCPLARGVAFPFGVGEGCAPLGFEGPENIW